METVHQEAVWRARRIIMNSDGFDGGIPSDIDPKRIAEAFLASRLPLAGTQVDSIFYCTGVFNVYSHHSNESELGDWGCAEGAEGFSRKLIQQGTDTLTLVTNFCHANSMECFWSMRMNDQHDAGRPHLLSTWKQQHREWLMNDNDGYPKWSWSAIDYTVPEVREKVFRILEDVARRYPVDGIELDFFRHPILFKAQMKGEPVTQEHCDLMTTLIARIREMSRSVAQTRSRPFLLAVRVPDSIGYCRAIGIDLQRWLDDRLIDIVSACDYFKLEPWENLVALGKKYEVPVYASFCSRRITQGAIGPGDASGEQERTQWRGEAMAAWKAGVNGIYVFNRPAPHDPLYRELGDPAVLETLDRIDKTAYAGEEGSNYLDPGFWVKDGRQFLIGRT